MEFSMINKKHCLKLCLMSDMHGDLPVFDEKVDVVGIAGDIVPLEVQNDTVKSIVWFTRKFVPWAESLNCQKVLLVGGNHDRFLQRIVSDCFENITFKDDKDYIEYSSAELIKSKLILPKKIVYLQDTVYFFNHVKFYGTPWCPDLPNWAFYKSSSDLEKVFNKIPDDCDVLITHAPGTENDMGTSMWNPAMPMYGCRELTEKVKRSGIKLWAAGHVHTGNHKVGLLSNGVTQIVNVSLKDEDYRVKFEPLVIEI